VNDEENKETSEDITPEEPQAEDAQSAGPVAEEDTSSSQAAGDVPSPTPPAEESSESDDSQDDAAEEEPAQDETPEEESADAPVAEQAQDEGDEAGDESADEAPAAEEPEAPKEKKKDVIPGADLEPIAVESDERPLSAEERARIEAEEEERASREAELVGGSDDEPSAASRAPAKMESGARYLATGKRKRSIARVTLLPGSGKFEINKRELEEFFPRPLHQTMVRQPLATTGYEGSVDVRVRVHGGGVGGQAGAVRHGIARALTEIDPELRGELKRRGFLTRDARVKERRKAGLKKARKRPQFSKR
jgi:small subunit ribosomal protein S9